MRETVSLTVIKNKIIHKLNKNLFLWSFLLLEIIAFMVGAIREQMFWIFTTQLALWPCLLCWWLWEKGNPNNLISNWQWRYFFFFFLRMLVYVSFLIIIMSLEKINGWNHLISWPPVLMVFLIFIWSLKIKIYTQMKKKE